MTNKIEWDPGDSYPQIKDDSNDDDDKFQEWIHDSNFYLQGNFKKIVNVTHYNINKKTCSI